MPTCNICGLPITHNQFRIKVWNQTEAGDTNEREYIHVDHIKEAYRATN